MSTDFFRQYALRSDEELLELASDRVSLTEEARSALDAEMRNRGLTPADVQKHERLAERDRRRAARRKNRKLFGALGSRFDNLVAGLWILVVVALLTAAYLALPSRYRFPPDWEEVARFVMFASVAVAVTGSSLRRKARFWLALVISSTGHALLLHAWIARFGGIEGSGHRGYEQMAILAGLLLFGAVYGAAHFVRRKSGVTEQA